MKYILYTHMSYNVQSHRNMHNGLKSIFKNPWTHYSQYNTTRKLNIFLLVCQVLAEKNSCFQTYRKPHLGRMFCREPRMVLAEGGLLFSCLGVVGDIRYSNDLGLMKRHCKRLYFYKGSRELVCKILLQS